MNDFATARKAILDRSMPPEKVREADEAFGRIEVLVTELQEALIWCSAASDLQPGGKAHEGWKKIRHLTTR